MARLEREHSKVIGRVAIGRTIRFDAREATGELPLAPEGSPAPQNASRGSDLLCSRCGVAICEGTRLKLFAGIVLRCTGCGEPNRVPR